jgi:hypothetical protein
MTMNTEFIKLLLRSFDLHLLALAVLAGLVLAAVALSFMALFRAKSLFTEGERHATARIEECQVELRLLRERYEAMAAELKNLRDHPPTTIIPGIPRSALNLTTRSQAIRMHRLGEPPEKIAHALDIPLQQVGLLLKVHKILITNI